MNVSIKWMLGCALLLSGASVGHAQNVNGTLRVVKGDVQVKSGKTGETSKARLGGQVFPKDVIITGADSRAKIVMVDNNEINVSPDSQIEIQRYEFDPNAGKKEVLLNVIYGKVRNKVEQHYDGKTTKFEVKTAAAVAGVRGTDFMTSYNKSTGESQVVTFRGAVAFGTPGPGGSIANAVSVTPGKMASSTGGAAPSAPITMSKAALAKMDAESRAEAPATGSTKNGPAPASDKGNKDSGASNGSGSSGTRAPASDPSVGGGATRTSMLSTEDLSPNAGSNNNIANAQQTQPPPPPPPPAPPVLPTCTTCQSLIQSGTPANLNIHIK